MGGNPFSTSAMARCLTFLEPHFRKARIKSRNNVPAARQRLHLYARRSAEVRREMVRKAIGQAELFTGDHRPIVPLDTDTHPFTGVEFEQMGQFVQKAADRAITRADGDTARARQFLWEEAMSSPELEAALSGLLILALR